MPSDRLPGRFRIDAREEKGFFAQMQTFLERLTAGGITFSGLRLDVSRTAIPTAAPEAGQPNLVAVNVSGTIKLAIYDKATGWVVVGSQS